MHYTYVYAMCVRFVSEFKLKILDVTTPSLRASLFFFPFVTGDQHFIEYKYLRLSRFNSSLGWDFYI